MGDVCLVVLDLVPGGLIVGREVDWALQLDHHQRKAVNEQHDVRATYLLAMDGELAHGQQLVAAIGADYWHPQHLTPAIIRNAIQGDAVTQPVVQFFVAVDQRLVRIAAQFGDNIINLDATELRVEAGNGIAKGRC
ncbi:hypothetical protein D3C71_1130540 [compost metagenome]